MKKHLAYYENEWPANIAELTAVENKPFVGYLKGTKDVKYTIIPAPVTGPADNEIWYTSINGTVVSLKDTSVFGVNFVSNTYEDGKGIITFDGDITSIGNAAFGYNYAWTSITVPNSVTSIGKDAFYYCENLTSVTIGNSVTSIGEAAFSYCTGLTSITIPNSVTSIGKSAFAWCINLTSITYDGTQEQWSSITKGDSWNNNVPATYVQCSDGQVEL